MTKTTCETCTICDDVWLYVKENDFQSDKTTFICVRCYDENEQIDDFGVKDYDKTRIM